MSSSNGDSTSGSGPVITGGVQLGVAYGSQGDQTIDGSTGDNGGVWFDPVAFYCEQEGVNASDCAYFCNLCRGTCIPTLINPSDLQGSAPQYPTFSEVNIEALGICQIFAQWVYSTWWSQQTGQPEQGSGPPVITPPTGTNPGKGG